MPHSPAWGVRFLYFCLLWLWASWWMGDSLRICYENSFFVADASQMRFLLQQSLGWIAAIGRAFILPMRYPWLGGLILTTVLFTATMSIARVSHLPLRWRWLASLPAIAWMTWVAWLGLNLYYQSEPGTPFGWLVIAWGIVVILDLLLTPIYKRKRVENIPEKVDIRAFFFLPLFIIPFLTTHFRHPYQRPVTQMQVQLLNQDWEGMSQTAHDNAELSYRPLAAYYAIALVHTGHLTDQMFDIRLDYDTLYLKRYGGTPDIGTSYYNIDCNFHAGLFRPATRRAMEHLTMQGPTLYSLKYLAKLALAESDWPLASKYLHILRQQPFEGEFVSRYSAMLNNADAVRADTEMATVMRTIPTHDDFESMYQEPIFLGFNAVRMEFPSAEALMQCLMVNLYSKRMPDFLYRCQPLIGGTPPKTIAEGLVTQSIKNPSILQAFPSLNMDAQTYRVFISTLKNELKDRQAHARALFKDWKGYYPYYYFFGNLRATRPTPKESPTDNGAVN